MPPHLMTVPAGLIPVIGSIRVSMAREEMISPDIQRASIGSAARRAGRTVVRWIVDPDATGRNFKRNVMDGIRGVEQGEAQEIWVYRYDRWGRNAVESLANCRRVELAGGQVVSATEPVDVETAIGRYSRTNAFAIAEMQSDQISENWKAAIANRVDRQLTTNGSKRFGYVRHGRIPADQPHRYRRDPNDAGGERYEPDYAGGTADDHVEMYDQYIGGKSFGKVRDWLNARGIRNTRGGAWSDVTVKNVLDSGFGAGLLRLHDPECKCRKATSCTRRIYVEGAHPAIIDADTWAAYLKTRASRAARPRAGQYASYPLTGLIKCGHCGSSMGVQSAVDTAGYAYRCKRWHHYRDCPAAFPQRLYVEGEVRAELARWAEDIDERAAITATRNTARVTAEVDRDRLSRALADADKALTRLAVQKAKDEEMPASVYEAARAELLEDRALIERDLAATAEVAETSKEDYLPIAVGVLAEWETLPPERIRDMLAELIRHVEVFRADPAAPRVVVTPVWVACSPDCKSCKKPAA